MSVYKQLKSHFDKRAKHKTFRRYKKNHHVLRQEGDDILLCDKWHNGEMPEILRVSPDDVLTVTKDLRGNDISAMEQLRDLVRGKFTVGRAPSATYTCAMVVCSAGEPVAPFIAGIMLDLKNRKVLNPTPLVKAVTDRKASQPLYKHVRRCVDMMTLLYRMGQLSTEHTGYGHTGYTRRMATLNAFNDAPCGTSEGEITQQAETAWEWAKRNYHGVHSTVYNAHKGLTEKRPEHEVEAEKVSKIRDLAAKYLREKLKAAHEGCIVKVHVTDNEPARQLTPA